MHRTKFYVYSLLAGLAVLLSSTFYFTDKGIDTTLNGNKIVISTTGNQSFVIAVKDKDELFTSYDFGILEIGKSKTQEFAIKNTGNAKLDVTKISSSDPQFVPTEAKDKVVPPGGFTVFDITFTPKALGEQSAKITIINNDFDEAEFEFKVTGGDPDYGKDDGSGAGNNNDVDDANKEPEIEVLVN